MKRNLFVTTALPYANGPLHIGHIMEYIQADIWVRFQKMRGNEVHFVCAEDAHGAPIMIAAEKAGKTPQQFIDEMRADAASAISTDSMIGFDHWHTTDSPENVELSQSIYRALKAKGLIDTRTIEQFYDPVKGMFLPDRYIKGTCPKCGAKDQNGDNCEVCGSTYAPTELIDPYSVLTGARPELRQVRALLLPLSDPRCVEFLRSWTAENNRHGEPRLQPEVYAKTQEWLGAGGKGLADWDISRDAPYFGIPIPDAPGKYLLRLARRADRLPRFVEGVFRQRQGAREGRTPHFRRVHRRRRCRADPFHRQGHRLLPHAVLAGDAAVLRPQGAGQHLRARLHHRQRREDEQEPRHRHRSAALSASSA